MLPRARSLPSIFGWSRSATKSGPPPDGPEQTQEQVLACPGLSRALSRVLAGSEQARFLDLGQPCTASSVHLANLGARVVVEPDSFEWVVNRDKIHRRALKEVSDLADKLRRTGAQGSVTFFTNGRTLTCESLKVVGELDPRWIERGLDARALAELERLAPGIVWAEFLGG